MMTRYPLWERHHAARKQAWYDKIAQSHVHIKTRITVEIFSVNKQFEYSYEYTIQSSNTLLVLAEMFDIIRTGLALHVIGQELCCQWKHQALPPVGEKLVMHPHKDTWLTMAAGFCERGARATTTLHDQELHPDIKALLDACEHGKKIVLTVLDPRAC